jgi:hypothetical protein
MAFISGNPIIAGYDIYSSSATPVTDVGQLIFGDSGKAFRYALAGASALVVGNVLQSSVADTQFDSLAIATAVAVGDRQITVTNGTTAVTANQFNGGSLSVSVNSASGTNLGEEYTIIGHSTATNGSSWVITVDRPVRTAMTVATTKVRAKRSLWSGVIQCPTTLTGVQVGVAVYPIAAAEYGWIQTKGVASVLSDNSTGAIGSDVGVPGASAGSVGVNVAGTGKSNTVGRAISALASGVAVPIYLLID